MRETYDALTATNRDTFTITYVEQVEIFKAWLRAYRIAHDQSSLTEWEQEYTAQSFNQFMLELEEVNHEQRATCSYQSGFSIQVK